MELRKLAARARCFVRPSVVGRSASTRIYFGANQVMIVTTKDLFEQAYGKYAVGAYNINNLEQTVGLFRGCVGKKSSNEREASSTFSRANSTRRIQLSRFEGSPVPEYRDEADSL